MMATSHKRFQWIVLLMFWFCFVHEASNAFFTCVLLLLGKCSHRCFTCNCRSILSPIIYILLLQELKFFAILLHLKKKKKTEWVPLQKYPQKECIQLEKGKDSSVWEEWMWKRSSRSSHRKNAFNWRRERIIQQGKNEMWMRRRKISDSYVAPRINPDKGGCNSRSR